MADPSLHPTHPEVIKRLKRAEGHLRTVIGMIEAQQPCLSVAQQLHAVEKAIATAKKALVHDHIDHCLDRSLETRPADARKAVEEFKEISKYL